MRVFVCILMLLHGFSFLLQPIGNPASMNFREMYQHCSAEDHDITPLDFVFEHLLNFEFVINCIEGENEDEHQPFQTVESSGQIAITIPAVMSINFSQRLFSTDQTIHTIHNIGFHSSNFSADIFHPPVV